MRIIDPNRLLPNEEVLRDVISSHPLDHNLASHLDTVEVFLSERCEIPREMILPDLENRKARLGLGRLSQTSEDFRYILYHEFSHVADRANPEFKYSEERRESLSESERTAVMELWNLFIDARLNRAELFHLGDQPGGLTRKHGFIPNTLEGKLLRHAVMLENQGVSYESALKLTTACWNDPSDVWTYEEMIEWVRRNTGEDTASLDRS